MNFEELVRFEAETDEEKCMLLDAMFELRIKRENELLSNDK